MSVSHSSRTTPRTSASHGRIVTQNSTLSAVLQREPSDAQAATNSPTQSVSVSRHSSALDVVSSHAIVKSNASTNPVNKTASSESVSSRKPDGAVVQYVAVSKSRLSLDSASNRDSEGKVTDNPPSSEGQGRSEPADVNVVPAESVSHVVTDSTEAPSDAPLLSESAQAVVINQSDLPDSARSNRYKYHSLKSKENTQVRKEVSYVKDRSGTFQASGGGTQHALSGENNNRVAQNTNIDTKDGPDQTNSDPAYVDTKLKIQPPSVRSQEAEEPSTVSKGPNSSELLHASSFTQEHRLDAPQHTRLSLNSQHDRVSRDRVPYVLDDNVKCVPPLDLNRISREQTPDSDISDSAPNIIAYSQRSDLDDQKLHESDRKTSLTHFSTRRDNNITGRRTYEVESPVLSNSLPHIKSSAGNFRQSQGSRGHQPDDQDTYRDRQGDPEQVELNRSDLADELNVPFPFDTQAHDTQGPDTNRPPSPPVQTTPPPEKEPATSLHSSSQVYAVANPDIQRAQGIEPRPDNYGTPRDFSHRQQGEVRFDSANRPQNTEEERADSKFRDRAPTPYARSPQREDLPPTPPDWEAPRESREESKRGSAASRVSRASNRSRSKQGLPPQHPPLDTLHTPKSGTRRRKNEDTQSIRRVYVESPSFTKEEEDEYRFVSSRLDDIEDKTNTFRGNMDQSRRGYGGDDNPAYNSRDRRTDSDYERRAPDKNRYEDRNDRYEDRGRDRYDDRRDRRESPERYDDRRTQTNGRDPMQDRYEDRTREMNGYSDYRDRDERDYRGRDDREERDRNERGRNDREPKYDTGSKYRTGNDRYDRLRDERDRYEDEPRREEEHYRGYRKQTTDMDDQDLRRETEYQNDLKKRIDKNLKIKDPDQDRERYHRDRRDSYDKENDYPRDSLEYSSDPRDGGRGGYARDSLEYNNYDQQQDWDNPPPNPYQEGQYYQQDQPGYVKQDSKPDFYDPEDAEQMELVNPKHPKTDYVEKNKFDYGMQPRKSYREIVHRKKEESEKLDHVFISPKLPSKPKKKAQQKAQSAQPQHLGHQPPPQYPVGFKPSSAEEVWAQRAQVLSSKKSIQAAAARQGKGSGHKQVQRWNSNPQVKQSFKMEPPPPLPNPGVPFRAPNANRADQNSREQGGYSQQYGYGTPTRNLQPIENKPAAPVSTEMVPTAINPASPFRRHMELKPISQEITTEDGQRISVDINLRLISPPPGQSGNTSPQQQQQLALMPGQDGQQQGGFGVPYQMQEYGNYDNGYGYSELYRKNSGSKRQKGAGIIKLPEKSEKRKVQFGDQNQYGGQYNGSGYQATGEPVPMDTRYGDEALTAAELELADPSGYSKKYQPGSVSFKDDVGSNSEMKSLEDGYASIYHKMKTKDPSEHPWYKVYKLDDYRKMLREVQVGRGTLGPDLDTESYRDKMEKRHKQFEYARMVMEKNRNELGHKKPPKFPRSPEKYGEEGAKRKTALEYAKNVPRPQVKPRPNQYNSYEVSAQISQGSPAGTQRGSRPVKGSPQPTQTMDVIDIRTLEQRHLQERKNADKIQRNMDSVLSQKAH